MVRRSFPSLLTFLLTLPALQAVGQGSKPYGPPVGVEKAKRIAAIALAEARKNNWLMAVAVVDPSATLVYYEKMDNTQTGSADVAIAEARTASLYKRPSKVFQDMVAGGGSGLRILGLPNTVPIDGGRAALIPAQLFTVQASGVPAPRQCVSKLIKPR